MSIDESKLTEADRLLLRLHRNMLARAKATGPRFDQLYGEHDAINMDIWDYVARLSGADHGKHP